MRFFTHVQSCFSGFLTDMVRPWSHHRKGHARRARWGLMAFLGLMMMLPSASLVAMENTLRGGLEDLQVDPHSGSANLGFPIQIVPGRGGIEPQMALAYSSSQKNGPLGVGWAMALGSIYRSTKTGNPAFDASDDFVLVQNGSTQELVLDTTLGYYRSKIEGAFLKIEKMGEAWQVTDTKGTRYFFGTDQASREFDPNNTTRILRWALNRVEDGHGNYMTVTYLRDQQKLYPQQIDYTGHTSGIAPHARVEFVYENTRPDIHSTYISGIKLTVAKRLARINIYADNSLQRHYLIDYSTSTVTGRSLLNRITMVGQDGVTAWPSTTFQYEDNSDALQTYEALVSIPNTIVADHLWNMRYDENYDKGHETYGPCPPTHMCYGVNWGSTNTTTSGTLPGGTYQTSAGGNLSFSARQDAAIHFWTYVYSPTAQTLYVPYSATEVELGVWINGDYNTHQGQNWPLKAGYNLVELTAYHQHQSISVNMNVDLANVVPIMHSSRLVTPQLSGDVNGDAFSDVISTTVSGDVTVQTSGGNTFATVETWMAGGFALDRQLMLADFNGDGRADIAGFDRTTGNWHVATSNGTQFIDAGTWLTNFGVDTQASAGDINGDGRSDIILFKKIGGQWQTEVALNTSDGQFTPSSDFAYAIGSDTGEPITGNFNGDNLIDFGTFVKSSGTWNIKLNTGGSDDPLTPAHEVLNFGANKRVVVTDFNGDGLTDIGYYDDTTGDVVGRLYSGSDFAPAQPLPFQFGIQDPNALVQTSDYNADGMVDWIITNELGDAEIALSRGEVPDLLTTMDNGLGAQSTLTYVSSSTFDNIFLPFAIPVVSSTTVSNGLGNSYTTKYSYADGFWEASSRDYRGFGLVLSIDPEGNYQESTFHQDAVLKGRTRALHTLSHLDELFSVTEMTWANEALTPEVNFTYLKRKDNFIYDGDATFRRTAEEFFYDEVLQQGAMTRAVQYGEVDGVTGADIGTDQRVVETDYVHNASAHILSLPIEVRVKDATDTVVRRTRFAYDNQAQGATPILGLLTKKESDALTGNAADNPVTQYVYDDVGNLLQTTDPLGRVTQIVYDVPSRIFPLTTTNALGHEVINTYYGINGISQNSGDGYQGLWGQLKSTTDPNGQQGQRVYDGFGRLLKSIGPLDSLSFPTVETIYTFGATYTHVLQKSRLEHGQGATLDQAQFIDALGRTIQHKSPSATPGQYVVSGQVEYNSRGLAIQQYLNRFTSLDLFTMDAIDSTQPATSVSYDAMGRVVRTSSPKGAYASTSYDDWRLSNINANGHRQDSIFDAYGRLMQKEEFIGADGRAEALTPGLYPASSYGVYATMQYQYDSEGNLIKTIDAHGNETLITYDGLGRKVRMHDPDMGVWTYAYDLNGNLSAQTDAKGQVVLFTYDALNRLQHKTDQVNVDVAYTYDALQSPYTQGRLTQVDYGMLDSTQFNYDELGREVQSVKAVDGALYQVDRAYDAASRVQEVIYPDRHSARYAYDAAGQVVRVTQREVASPISVPGAPALIQAAAGNNMATLTWASVAEADGYTVKYGTASGVFTQEQEAGNSTSVVITGLTNGTIYYFTVTAHNAGGHSVHSNELSATPANGPSTFDLTGFTKVDPLSTLSVTSNCVNLNNTEIENDDTYTFTNHTTTGDFVYELDTIFTDTTTGFFIYPGVWGVTNNTNTAYGNWTDGIAVYFKNASSLQMRLQTNGSYSTSSVLQRNQRYYLRIERQAGAVTLSIYDDANRTNLLDSLNRTDSSNYQYMYVVSSEENNIKTGRQVTGDVCNVIDLTQGGLVYQPQKNASQQLVHDARSATWGDVFLREFLGGIKSFVSLFVASEAYAADMLDFTTFNEQDPQNKIDLTSTCMTFSDIKGYSENAHTFKALTSSGDFVMEFDSMMSAGDLFVQGLMLWGVTNTANASYTSWADGIYLLLYKGGGNLRLELKTIAPSFWNPGSMVLDLNQRFYVTVRRIGSVVSVDIYDDAARLNVIDSLSANISPINYNYVYGVTTDDKSYTGKKSTGDFCHLTAGASGGGLFSPVMQAPSAGNSEVALSWTSVAGATSYRIDYGTSSGVYTQIVTGLTNTSTTITGLSNNTDYYFVVSALDAESQSAVSNEVMATPVAPQPPAIPGLNTATAGDGAVTLSWGAVSGATGYGLHYGTTSGSYTTTINVEAGATAVTIEGLNNQIDYYFVVTAINAVGSSGYSNELTATPLPAAPMAPVMQAPDVDNGQVRLNWTLVSGATGYQVHYGTTNEPYTQVTANLGSVNATTISGLSNGTIYYFAVTAMGPGGTSDYSNAQAAKPQVLLENSIVDDVTYNAQGQKTRVVYANGTVTTYTYDALDFSLTRIHTANAWGVVLQDLNYTYDPTGNIIQIVDQVNTADQTFVYDSLNRLVQATGDQYGIKSYAYDEIGNLLSKDGKAYTYGEGPAGPHAVTSLSDGGTFTYDANGNMLSKQLGSDLTLYQYDAENRLQQVVKNDTVIADYVYDGDGGRTQKITADGTVHFVGGLFETQGSQATSHMYLGDTRVASVSDGALMIYHHDHLGGTNVISDEQGAKLELIEYQPFGQKSRHDKYGQGPTVAHHYFTSQYQDDETGLYYYGARYYDPSLGRFISADTIVPSADDNQAFNRYAYVRNNPVMLVDPTGHFWDIIFALILSAVVNYTIDSTVKGLATGDWSNFTGETASNFGITTAATLGTSTLFSWGNLASMYASLTTMHILSTDPGKESVNWVSEEIFDDALGFSPQISSMLGNMIVHSIVASAVFIRITANTYTGEDFTDQDVRKTAGMESYGKNGKHLGGQSVSQMAEQGSVPDWYVQGGVNSQNGWPKTPILNKITKALGINHVASVVMKNGQLFDSAKKSLVTPWANGEFYLGPWTGVCQQACYANLIDGGMSGVQAFTATASKSGGIFYLTSAIYGVTGDFGAVGLTNAALDKNF